ncbi:MAG: hypothetical protein IPH58_10085 [Sphingobacteriales bacterium]|nr:hypothetical protein [Sphingobacteriales bacterium]
MQVQSKYLAVNWTDGMKLNKETFIAQDNAQFSNSYDLISSTLSPIRYGLLPCDNNFNLQIAIDNQNTVRVTVNACKAITAGGFPVSIIAGESSSETDGSPSVSLQISTGVQIPFTGQCF